MKEPTNHNSTYGNVFRMTTSAERLVRSIKDMGDERIRAALEARRLEKIDPDRAARGAACEPTKVTTKFVRRHYAQGPTAYYEDGSPAKWPTPADVKYAERQFDQWLAEHDRRLSQKVWYEGASSRQCHCAAYEEAECGCGMYPSEANPYLIQESASAGEEGKAS